MDHSCPLHSDETSILLDYAARRLSPAQLAWFEQHLQGCAECRAFAEAQQTVWRALDAWRPEPVSLDFNRRLFDRIEAERKLPWWRRLLLPSGAQSAAWVRPALSLALACSLMLGMFLWTGPEQPETQPADPAQARVEKTIDVEQVERALEDMDMLHQFGSRHGAAQATDTRTM